ncbi:hypothetical protein AAG570_010581 [Ranatra chinensis]|uniref:Uncharacterized protein n=1 Tax=Ranatra chinensis TaxID=642074 RepID=A0ABD0ZBA0_9HEMI
MAISQNRFGPTNSGQEMTTWVTAAAAHAVPLSAREMALETERRSPNNASSPGPDTPGSSGSGASPTGAEEKRPSAFHRIELLCSGTATSLGRPAQRLAPVYLAQPKERPQQPQPPAAALAFSVDNILRPDFAKCAALPPSTSPPSSATPRRRPDDEFPDAAKIDPPIPDDPASQMWPAWVYCTRYSDRPSSGQSQCTLSLFA